MEGEKKIGACCSLQPCLVISPSVSDREKEVNSAGSRTFSSFFSHREEPPQASNPVHNSTAEGLMITR